MILWQITLAGCVCDGHPGQPTEMSEMIWENLQGLCVVAMEGLVHGSGDCESGWTCVVATLLDGNVENRKIKK
jgi:hypothetical protein